MGIFWCRYWKECEWYKQGHDICEKDAGYGCGKHDEDCKKSGATLINEATYFKIGEGKVFVPYKGKLIDAGYNVSLQEIAEKERAKTGKQGGYFVFTKRE